MGLLDIFDIIKIKQDLTVLNERLKEDVRLEKGYSSDMRKQKREKYLEEMKKILLGNIIL